MSYPAKVDVLQAYHLKTVAHLSYKQIGQLQSVSAQAVHQALTTFLSNVPDAEQLASYTAARTQLLTAAEQQLVASCLDGAVIDKASLLDRGRTLKAIHGIRRLEEELSTQNVSSKMSLLISQADASLFSQSASPNEPSPPPASPGVGGESTDR